MKRKKKKENNKDKIQKKSSFRGKILYHQLNFFNLILIDFCQLLKYFYIIILLL